MFNVTYDGFKKIPRVAGTTRRGEGPFGTVRTYTVHSLVAWSCKAS